MKLRHVGFALTVAAVLVLLGSLAVGFNRGGQAGDYEVLVSPGVPRVNDRIRVEVLNGAGISGLARAITEELRAQGFDVVYYGNAGSLARDSTTILDRAGNEEAVAALSDALGVTRVESAIDTTLYLEATVVLGPDWDGTGELQGIGNRE